METPPKYEIFISYRRDGGVDYARMIYLELKGRGYNTFFDFNSLRSGKFNENIFKAIDECRYFILVLSNGALDRCVNEDDWVRHEIEYALSKGKEIIPVCPSGNQRGFPETMPESFEPLRHVQISRLEMDDLFDKSFDKIVEDRFAADFREGRAPVAASDVVTVRSFKKIGIGVIAAILVAAIVVGVSILSGNDGANTPVKPNSKTFRKLQKLSFEDIITLSSSPSRSPVVMNIDGGLTECPDYVAAILVSEDHELLINLVTNSPFSHYVFQNKAFASSPDCDSLIEHLVSSEESTIKDLEQFLYDYAQNGSDRNQELFVQIWTNPKIDSFYRDLFLDKMTDISLCNCLTNGMISIPSSTAAKVIAKIRDNRVWQDMLDFYPSISSWETVTSKDTWGKQKRSFLKEELLSIAYDDKLNISIRLGAIKEMPETMPAELLNLVLDTILPEDIRKWAIQKLPGSMAEDVLSNDKISFDLKSSYIYQNLRYSPDVCKDLILSGKLEERVSMWLLATIWNAKSGEFGKRNGFSYLAQVAEKAPLESLADRAVTLMGFGTLGFGQVHSRWGAFATWPDEWKTSLASAIKQTRWKSVQEKMVEHGFGELVEYMCSDPELKTIYRRYGK